MKLVRLGIIQGTHQHLEEKMLKDCFFGVRSLNQKTQTGTRGSFVPK